MAKQYWKPGNMLYPVPAVMVSCQRQGEKPNIITVAWAGTICSDPAMVSVSIQKKRYSYAIIRDSGEFVMNLTTKKLAKATDYCGVRSGKDVDKFAETGLTPCPSQLVSCPGIAESPVNIECRVSCAGSQRRRRRSAAGCVRQAAVKPQRPDGILPRKLF